MNGSKTLLNRMVRAVRLDGSLYAEVRADTTATAQALTVVAIVALSHGLGGAIRGAHFGWNPASGSLFGVLGEVSFFVVASFVVYVVARYVLGSTVDYPQVMRPLGFSVLPGLLILVAALVSMSWVGAQVPVLMVLIVWRLAAGLVAVRQASGLSLARSALALLFGVAAGMVAVVISTRALAEMLN